MKTHARTTCTLALSLLLHAAILCIRGPESLEAEKLHITGEFELLSIREETRPGPKPPKPHTAPPPEERPVKRRRMVKASPETPVMRPPDQAPQVAQSTPIPKPPQHTCVAEASPTTPAAEPNAESADAPPSSPAVDISGPSRAELLNLYAAQVRHRIESRKTYPQRARRQSMEGAVRVRFVLSPTGDVQKITIIRGSRFAMLNTAAKKAVLSAAPFPVIPGAMQKEPISIEVTLCFELT
ncbi:energy transducer TonB [Desulfoluna spongiiphila]|uniref:Outer membrane transport energization protein TonB n=1 Tax=Desulfoluna spongiiphila TaxID=419481 RepID=A0A1G5F4V5_9BACT|nr:energy transducer TonB [Desulfoluna spongiiphila]SCY34131.1 outer membrane transport energization protein TonB [Desulfoluna spongiiphila]